MKANRPHYHVWLKAKTGRIWYKLARSFNSHQAAVQWGKRNKPESERMSLKCEDVRCRPPLN